jgi:membrane protease YdiL (CAAX protease family)
MFPHIKEVNPIITIPIASLALSVPAIIEELTYRGAIFGFLLRLSRNNRWAIVASTLFVSLIWALGHLSNTNAPLIKCIQIFIIGIVFCEFARRISIESAIASHIALNVTIVILAFLVF